MMLRSRTLVISILTIFSSLLMMLHIERLLLDNMHNEIRIASNIGEIKRLDVALTLSAKLYTASKDPTYRQDYYLQAIELERIINDTFKSSADEQILDFLHDTKIANDHLVALELQALDMCQQDRCRDAYQLLHASEYIGHKSRYESAMNQALQSLESSSNRLSQRTQGLFIVAIVLFIALAVIFIYYWQRQQTRLREAAVEHAQYEALVITMTTVMDTYNNTLNNLLLYRLKMEESGAFCAQDLQEFDQVIYAAKQKLQQMGNMKSFKYKRYASYNLLDYPANEGH